MAIDLEKIVALVETAGRRVGQQELQKVGKIHPGESAALTDALRQLVKMGRLVRDGKRFGIPGEKPKAKSGPAWIQPADNKRMGIKKQKELAHADGGNSHPKRSPYSKELSLGKKVSVKEVPAAREHAGKAPAKFGKPSEKETHFGSKDTLRAAGRERAPSAPAARISHAPAQRNSGERTQSIPQRNQRDSHVPQRSSNQKLVEGIIHHHRDGFAFVKPVVGQVSEDLFIPPEEARKALDNDRVIVEVLPGRGGRTMGRLVNVVSRTRQMVVGVYEESPRGAYVTPRESELGIITVPHSQLCRPGDTVKVRLGVGESLFEPNNKLVGEVAGSLGAKDDHSVEVLSVAFAKGFNDEFPPEVMDEADVIPIDVHENEATEEGRVDLRQLGLVTIDGEDARDFDDAIYVEPHSKGTRLVVAIADVSHYVREGTALDTEGLRRATSVYLPGRVLPMLPERLSNGICSLKPDVDRLCMVADMVIDASGTTIDTKVYKAVMKSKARCTYTEVHKVLNGEDVPHRNAFKSLFVRANTLATTLTAMRLKRGAIDFDLPEYGVQLDEKGLPVKMILRERWESHRLVEECMLAANEAVARFFYERELPSVNRYHAEPDEERMAKFVTLLGAYGLSPPNGNDTLTSHELNDVLKKLEGHPEQRALNQLALRSMMQAVYSSRNTGHFGLGATDYLHFTSPIRRYPDLLVHRLLKNLWQRETAFNEEETENESDRLDALAIQCSERERASMQVEREVKSLYSCLLLKDKIGEEFEGTVCGLSENGFFVELNELHVEGFVRGESVYPDFEFNEATHRINFGSGQVVKVGLAAKVQLVSVNLQRKQIDFGILELDGTEVEEQAPRPRESKSKFGGKFGGKPDFKSKGDRSGDSRGGKPDWKSKGKPSFGKSGKSDFGSKQKSDWKSKSGAGAYSGASSKPGKPSWKEEAKFSPKPFDSRVEKPAYQSFKSKGDYKPGDSRNQFESRSRSAAPPKQSWEKEESAKAPVSGAGFDAIATLERLRRQKMGAGGGSSGKQSGESGYAGSNERSRKAKPGSSRFAAGKPKGKPRR
jgi:ribonuclease R